MLLQALSLLIAFHVSCAILDTNTFTQHQRYESRRHANRSWSQRAHSDQRLLRREWSEDQEKEEWNLLSRRYVRTEPSPLMSLSDGIGDLPTFETQGGNGDDDHCSPKYKINGTFVGDDCAEGCCREPPGQLAPYTCECKCSHPNHTTSATCPTGRCNWTGSSCECVADAAARRRSPNRCNNLGVSCGNQNKNEADVYCCESCKTAPENIRLGGTDHSTHYYGALERPEFLKSTRCSPSECLECSSNTNCWVPYDEDGSSFQKKFGKINPLVKAVIDEGSGFSNYSVRAYATCDNDKFGRWTLILKAKKNAILQVYLDNELNYTYPSDDYSYTRGQKKRFIYTNDSYQHFQLVVSPINASDDSFAYVSLYIERVKFSLDACMTKETCKDHLLGSSLLNSNEHQLKCLRGQTSTFTLTENATCDNWTDCLDDHSTPLLAILEAAIGNNIGASRSSLTEMDSFMEKADSTDCIDPAIEDPESWDCECLTQWTETPQCGGTLSIGCLNTIICDSTAVCQHWKDDNCASRSSYSSALIERARELKQDNSLAQSRSELDEAPSIDISDRSNTDRLLSLSEEVQPRSLLTIGGRTRLMQRRALEGFDETMDNDKVDLSIVRKDCR